MVLLSVACCLLAFMHVPTHLPHESLVLHVDSTLHQFWGLRLSGTHSVSDRMDIILPPINFGSSGKIPKIKKFVAQVLRTDLPPVLTFSWEMHKKPQFHRPSLFLIAFDSHTYIL